MSWRESPQLSTTPSTRPGHTDANPDAAQICGNGALSVALANMT
jgi:hypothetical protein